MKKVLLAMLAVSLGLAAISCGDRDDAKTKNAPEFNFRKTTWGMSRARVMESEDTEPTGEKADVVTYRDELEGIPVIVGYLFDGDTLTRAGYLMRGSYEDPGKYIEDYKKVKELMIMNYGAPAQDELRWNEGEESQDPAKYGEAVCGGKLTYITIWTDGVTVVRESLRGEKGMCSHGLMFESVALYHSKPAGDDAAAVPSPAP